MSVTAAAIRRVRPWRAGNVGRAAASEWARSRRRSELGLLLVALVTVVSALLLLSLAVTNALPRHVVEEIAVLAGIGLYVQFVNRLFIPDADPVIMPVALALNGLGYVMIEALDPAEAHQQVLWTIIGLVVYTALLYFVKHSRDLDRYRYLLLIVAFLLLVAPLMPIIGNSHANVSNAYGAKLWIGFHGITFQPIEIAKLLLVVFFASYFVEKRELLTIPTRRVGDHLLPDLRAFGPVAVAWLLSLGIILLEHDIGFSLLLFAVFLTLLWVTTGRWTYVIIGLVLFAVGAYLSSHILGQVNERMSVWLNPWSQAQAGGYQPIQAWFAFARGGLWGSGLGLGVVQQPNVLPVATSDYIFAAFGEELGLIGTSAIVVGYLLIVGSGLRAGLRARSDFAKLAAVGLTLTLGFQAFIIMAGVTRILPDTGMTLPFVSYGGSSLVANYVLLALLMRISNEGNQAITATPPPRFLPRRAPDRATSKEPVVPRSEPAGSP